MSKPIVKAASSAVVLKSFESLTAESIPGLCEEVEAAKCAELRMWSGSASGAGAINFAAGGTGELVLDRPESKSKLRGRKKPTREMLVHQDHYALAQAMADGREAARLAREAASITSRIVVDAESIDASRERAQAIERIEARKAEQVPGVLVPVEAVKGQDKFSAYSFRRSTSAVGSVLLTMERHAEALRIREHRAQQAAKRSAAAEVKGHLAARVAQREEVKRYDWLWEFLRDLASSAAASATKRVESGFRRADSQVASLGRRLGVSNSGHERIESAGHWSGGRYPASEADRADAFGCAVSAVWEGARRLCSVRLRSTNADGAAEHEAIAGRLLPLPGAIWAPGTIGGARAMWLRRQAWKAAFASLTENWLSGETSAARAAQFVGLEIGDWGKLHDREEQEPCGYIRPSELACGFETLPATRPADQFRAARAMIWSKLGCVLPREWSQDHNTRVGQCARVRQFVLLGRVLAGVPLSDAAMALGYSPTYARTGFRKTLALFGLVPSKLEPGLHAVA